MTQPGGSSGPGWYPVVSDRGPTERAVRIGDAERDAAVSALGDHFAAGRLTREEFDERVEAAMTARVGTDLVPLFADLPGLARMRTERAPRRPGAGFSPPMMIFPLLVLVGMVTAAVVWSAPWIIWGLVWVLFCSPLGRRRVHSGG